MVGFMRLGVEKVGYVFNTTPGDRGPIRVEKLPEFFNRPPQRVAWCEGHFFGGWVGLLVVRHAHAER